MEDEHYVSEKEELKGEIEYWKDLYENLKSRVDDFIYEINDLKK